VQGRPVGCVDAGRKKFLHHFKAGPAGGRHHHETGADLT